MLVILTLIDRVLMRVLLLYWCVLLPLLTFGSLLVMFVILTLTDGVLMRVLLVLLCCCCAAASADIRCDYSVLLLDSLTLCVFLSRVILVSCCAVLLSGCSGGR